MLDACCTLETQWFTNSRKNANNGRYNLRRITSLKLNLTFRQQNRNLFQRSDILLKVKPVINTLSHLSSLHEGFHQGKGVEHSWRGGVWRHSRTAASWCVVNIIQHVKLEFVFPFSLSHTYRQTYTTLSFRPQYTNHSFPIPHPKNKKSLVPFLHDIIENIKSLNRSHLSLLKKETGTNLKLGSSTTILFLFSSLQVSWCWSSSIPTHDVCSDPQPERQKQGGWHVLIKKETCLIVYMKETKLRSFISSKQTSRLPHWRRVLVSK